MYKFDSVVAIYNQIAVSRAELAIFTFEHKTGNLETSVSPRKAAATEELTNLTNDSRKA